ncbi:MAG: DEAD/DEAH box helicase [Opitutaceae bacterium]|nr:DEAD/DEAH box helicase [Opitutaceae bacterium]
MIDQAPASTMAKGFIYYSGGEWAIQFDRKFMAGEKYKYFHCLELIQKLGQKRFDDVRIAWYIPLYDKSVECIRELIKFGLTPTKSAREALAIELEKQARKSASTECKEEMIKIEKLGKLDQALRNFQRHGILWLSKVKRGYLGDEQGLGKSIQALGVVEYSEAYPAVVVCPVKIKKNWIKEIRHWLPHRTVSDNPRALAEITVLGYTELHKYVNSALASPKSAVAKAAALANTQQWFYPDLVKVKAVVCDEAHFIKEVKSKRSQAPTALALVCDSPVRLCLSGTPVENRPAELISPMKFLGVLKDFGGQYEFEKKFCAARRRKMGNRYIWDSRGASNLKELNNLMRNSFYIRRLKSDVLKDLPPKIESVLEVDITNTEEYRAAERDVVTYMLQYKEHLLSSSAMDNAHLIRLNKLRQLVGIGKVEWIVDWVDSFLESGEKFVLYAYHPATQEALARLLGRWNPAKVFAGCKDVEKEEKKFKEDESCRLFLGSIGAAGFGLTLTTASHIGLAELTWVQAKHWQVFDRIHRIGQQRCVNAYYFLAPKTIDDDMWSILSDKAQISAAAADGREMPKSEALSNLVRKMITRN